MVLELGAARMEVGSVSHLSTSHGCVFLWHFRNETGAHALHAQFAL